MGCPRWCPTPRRLPRPRRTTPPPRLPTSRRSAGGGRGSGEGGAGGGAAAEEGRLLPLPVLREQQAGRGALAREGRAHRRRGVEGASRVRRAGGGGRDRACGRLRPRAADQLLHERRRVSGSNPVCVPVTVDIESLSGRTEET